MTWSVCIFSILIHIKSRQEYAEKPIKSRIQWNYCDPSAQFCIICVPGSGPPPRNTWIRWWKGPSNPPSLAHLAQVCDSTVHGLSIPSSRRKPGKPMKSRTSMKYWNMEILWNYEHLTFCQCAMSVPARKPWFLKLIPNSHVSDPLDFAPLRILAHCSAELFTARRANTSSHAQGNESPFPKKTMYSTLKSGQYS